MSNCKNCNDAERERNQSERNLRLLVSAFAEATVRREAEVYAALISADPELMLRRLLP